MIWLVLILMAAGPAAALLYPLLRARPTAAPRAAHDLEVYRDQLAELERDVARGLVSDAEAKAARTEIARRILAAADGETAPVPVPAPRPSSPFPIAVAASVPILALALYVGLGSPGLPGMPLAERRAAEARHASDSRERLETMVSGLAQRLQQNPDDLHGWTLLARSLTTLERHADAVVAWRQVMRLSDGAPEHAGPFAETLVQTSNGVVTPEAKAAFERVLRADPADPRARFYLALARAQAGDLRGALQDWTDLVAMAAPDAPWLPVVRSRIRDTAAEARIDPATLKPSPDALKIAEAARDMAPRGPGAAEIEAMQRMSPEERQAAIRSMVEGLAARLEANPGDVEGWRRLGRAWRVLGEADKAREAFRTAAERAPERPEVLADLAGMLLEGHREGEKLPADFVSTMRRVLALDPGNADALWFVGLAEAEAGRRDQAAELWTRLLAQLPEGSRERDEIEQRLAALTRQAP